MSPNGEIAVFQFFPSVFATGTAKNLPETQQDFWFHALTSQARCALHPVLASRVPLSRPLPAWMCETYRTCTQSGRLHPILDDSILFWTTPSCILEDSIRFWMPPTTQSYSGWLHPLNNLDDSILFWTTPTTQSYFERLHAILDDSILFWTTPSYSGRLHAILDDSRSIYSGRLHPILDDSMLFWTTHPILDDSILFWTTPSCILEDSIRFWMTPWTQSYSGWLHPLNNLDDSILFWTAPSYLGMASYHFFLVKPKNCQIIGFTNSLCFYIFAFWGKTIFSYEQYTRTKKNTDKKRGIRQKKKEKIKRKTRN